ADSNGRVCGLRCQRPDGAVEDLECRAMVLACCGFAGNPELVSKYIPEIADAEFFGHPGNKGEAIDWGTELGAGIKDIHAYQGHGGLAVGQGVPILWPVIMEGGFQVNINGQRFSNESKGYSEQAVEVVAQPEHVAWTIYDERLHTLMQEFDDYRDAMAQKAIRRGDSLDELCEATRLPPRALQETLERVAALTASGEACEFGRTFADRSPLSTPYYAVKVTGALFHTQGGLDVDGHGQVLRTDGSALPNLFAGGGAARGVSGSGSSGYMAGNGLLTATTFGRLAGTRAAGC
ncbi:MAG: FAD-binding protein, partial [Woeseiaceae bacterium]